MKKYRRVLIERQQKYQPNHQVKLINVDILQVKNMDLQLSKVIEQAKLTYSPLEKLLENHLKTIEDQGRKQVEALKALKPAKNN